MSESGASVDAPPELVEEHGLSDAEPWPEWREPPARDVARPAPSSTAPFVDDAAFQLENLRAGIAQATAIVPFVGPAVAFGMNRRGSFARREAAKAFNGQATTLVLAPATVALSFVLYLLLDLNPREWFPFSSFFGTVVLLAVLLGGSVVHAVAGMLLALRGVDWTSPLTRLLRVQILPEGEPDPTRRRR